MKTLLFYITVSFGLFGCALSPRHNLSNVYRNGDDSDNSIYLILRSNNSYDLVERSSDAVESRVEPFNSLIKSGSWELDGNSIVLEDSSKVGALPERLQILQSQGAIALKTINGLGRNSNPYYVVVLDRKIVQYANKKNGLYWKKIEINLAL